MSREIRAGAAPICPSRRHALQIASMSKAVSSTLVATVPGDGATISSPEAGFALADPWVSAQVSSATHSVTGRGYRPTPATTSHRHRESFSVMRGDL